MSGVTASGHMQGYLLSHYLCRTNSSGLGRWEMKGYALSTRSRVKVIMDHSIGAKAKEGCIIT
jgi:hypothetical protein